MIDQDLRKDIDIAVDILRRAGATEVFVFGSAAHGQMRPDSDLDLAIRGLPPESFFRTMSEVTFAVSRPLDLVDLDEENLFTDYLVREGELLRVA